MTPLFRKTRWLLTRSRKQAELDEELRFHLDAERDERRDAGASPDEAARQARIEFGNPAVIREDTRAAWGGGALEQLGQDVRYAIRTMRRSPAFALLAVLSLALGIGVNTAFFGFMDAMLLQPLPVRDPEQLVRMRWRALESESHGTSGHSSSFTDSTEGYRGGVFSYAALEAFQKHDRLFSHVFAYQATGSLTVGVRGQAEVANGEYVSGEYFPALGVRPAAGRGLEAGDDQFGAPPVAVVSAAFSRRGFASASDTVGQTITVNRAPFTIVGVMPPGFFGTDPGKAVDLYVPLHTNVLIERSSTNAQAIFGHASTWWLEIMARRRPGVTIAQIQAEAGPPFQQVSDDLKANSGRWQQAPSLEVIGGSDGIDGLRRTYGSSLFMLFALAVLILALACTNIASLLLARSRARTREIAVRLSLGASRARVVRQLLTESLVLSLLGGGLGVLVAIWTQAWVTARLTNTLAPFGIEAALNWRVLAVAGMVSVLTGLLFGLAPALQATRGRTLPGLKETRSIAATSSWRRASPRRILLVIQVAITLVMLVAAGLFLRTLGNYESIARGFRSDHVLVFNIRADQAGLAEDAAATLYRGLFERLSTLPGVQSVGMSEMPLIGDGRSSTTVEPGARAVKDSSQILHVGPGFFSTMQVSLIKGRAITADDVRPGAAPVVVIDQTYADKFFPGADPLGQYVRVPHDAERVANWQFAVVGVASNARLGRLSGAAAPTVYFPFTAAVFGRINRMTFELRTAGDPIASADAARKIVRDTNSGVPIVRMTTQDALIESTIRREVLLARLCTMFAGLALAIAVIGLYGTVLHDVARRRAEIGVRMALGARRGQVIFMVIRDVLVVVAIGVLVGIPAARGAARISESLLFGITRADVPTTVAATLMLLVAALAAAFGPAFRAARVNPGVALRDD